MLMVWQLHGMAQTSAVAKLDTTSITIGDQTGLDLTFTCPANAQVHWPQLADTLTGEIEIVKKTALDSTLSDDKTSKLYHQRLTITAFDSGYFAIPPIKIAYKEAGDPNFKTAETDASLLEVKTVPVNLEQEIKDIKGPLAAPFTFREALPYILVFLGVAVVVFLVIYYLRKRKKSEPLFQGPPKPQLPPHRIALDAFDELRYKKLWQNGQIKEYHTELVDIIRDYLLGNFNIHAAEYTSDEIMEAVSKTAANPQAKEKLRQTLIMADLVKFAKHNPLPIEHDASLNNAVDFVKETMHLNMQEPNNAAVAKVDKPKEETPTEPQERQMESQETVDRKEAGDV